MSILVLAMLAIPADGLPQMPALACFTTDFVQTRNLPMLDQPLTLKGRLRIEHDGAMEWQVSQPYNYRFTVRGDEIIEVTPDGARRIVDARQAPWLAGMQQLFDALLAGNHEDLHNWFNAVEDIAVPEGRRLTLEPLNSAVAEIVGSMQVIHGEHLREVRITDASGGNNRIVFDAPIPCPDEVVQ